MQQKVINPWKWQDRLGFVQATEINEGQRLLFVSGQVSVDADGNPMHAGNMQAQINQTIDNLETILKGAGFSASNIVRLTIYTTNMDLYLAHADIIAKRMTQPGGRYSCTLLGVNRLAHPDFMFELEATAVK